MKDSWGRPSKVATCPSMVESEFVEVARFVTAREYESNGLRSPLDREGNFNGCVSGESLWPYEKLCGYTLNKRGKVVRWWSNRHERALSEARTIPKGDYVTESIFMDSIQLNKETRSVFSR